MIILKQSFQKHGIQLILAWAITIGFFSFSLNALIPTLSSAQSLPNLEWLPPVEWQIRSQAPQTEYVYTPFYIDGAQAVFYSGGAGVDPKNGVLKMVFDLKSGKLISKKTVIKTGPDLTNYNYFRAPRVSKNGNELWMLVEVAGCYAGCDSSLYPKSLAVYRSNDEGESWSFSDFVKLNGQRYVATWFGHTGLIYNPQAGSNLNLMNPAKNKFITVGENRDIMVSADGINFASIPMQSAFPKDRLVFASIAQTPYGFHLMTCSNWSDTYYTTTIRHLFSKDLVNWIPIESNSYLKNTHFYKGVHLSYDSTSQKLWAYSPCGSLNGCNIFASLEAKDYLQENQQNQSLAYLPIGEVVSYNSQQGLINSRKSSSNGFTYSITLLTGAQVEGLSAQLLQRPLLSYKRTGCAQDQDGKICIGDSISYGNRFGSILGINSSNSTSIKYAIKFNDGVVDTGYTQQLLKFY